MESKQNLQFFLLFGSFLKLTVSLESTAYDVVWNAPTVACRSLFGVSVDPKPYGIRENDQNGILGNVIALFYKDLTGLYPEYTESGQAVNGGLPQLVNMTAHLAKVEADVEKYLPNKTFDGYGVLDWESWRPVWERNYDSKSIYQKKSVDLVMAKHPTWSKAKVEAAAKEEFEAAAKNLMLRTLDKFKTLRPRGKWGFYLFPECYNYQGDKACSTKAREDNNKLLWLFNASTALYPSAYLPSKLDEAQRYSFVHGQAQEARRVRSILKKDNVLPIYVYTRFQLAGSRHTWYTAKDLQAAVYEPSLLGVEGIVVWGASYNGETAAECSAVKNYLQTTYGSFAQKTIKSAKNCSAVLCHSHGRCILDESTKQMRPVSAALKYTSYDPNKDSQRDKYFATVVNNGIAMMKHGLDQNYIEAQYSCQCFSSWKGHNCDVPTL